MLLPSQKRNRVQNVRSSPWSVWFLLCSLVAHLLFLTVATPLLDLLPATPTPPRRALTLVIRDPAPETPPPEPEEPPKPEYEGQIVEISPPKVEVVPVESDYLSEYDAATEKETRAERFEVNPEVLSREFSKEMQAEAAEVVDLNAEKESTGATVGNNRFDPDRNGTMSALPSPWKQTNQLGPQDPIPSSSRTASLSGAPQNDLLDEEIGKYVDLNTTRYPYAGYIQRIRRQVNYWWQQNIDNLSSSVRLSKSRYQTVVSVVLNADGALEHIEVIGASGSPELDDCLVRAFRVAAPFENPPAGLVEKDGRVYLPEFDFTLTLQAAQMQYRGIDPRAGVQFPGILKSPR